MNGQNSNTSGSDVASVAFWPKAVLESALASIGKLVADIKRVVSGEAKIADVDFAKQSGTHKISDATMAEIAGRLVVTFEEKAAGNVVFSVQPPEDKSKVWWQIDPVTSIPIGQPRTWNEEQQAWLPIGPGVAPFVPPKRRFGRIFAPQGASQSNLDFADIGTVEYLVTLTPTTFVNGVWNPAPNSFPTHFGWVVTNKANNQITVAFFGTPTGGISFEVDIEERIIGI